MTNSSKPLAKSLHTVSVLVKLAGVARTMGRNSGIVASKLTDENCVTEAMIMLGIDQLADPHGLRAAAVKAMGKAA